MEENVIEVVHMDEKCVEVVLELKPLAPISITKQKGVFNKTSVIPSNHNLYGLLENILGIRIGLDTRNKIIKKLKLNSEKRQGKLFVSLISHNVDILNIKTPKKIVYFNDSMSYLNRRLGEEPHIKGVKNIDKSMVYSTMQTLVDLKVRENLPNYYTSIYKQQYFNTDDSYFITLKTTQQLYNQLEKALRDRSTYYLGNSDGLIDVMIKEVCKK